MLVTLIAFASLALYASIASTILALSETINGAILGLFIAVIVAVLASLKKLALIMIRFSEAVAKQKIESWAKDHGVDKREIFDD
jgi:hypothetical protein